MKDYYNILGINRAATEEEIKKAYHRLAHKYHPDKGGNEQKFKEINEAYQVLSNKDRRSQYDRFGRVFDGGAAGQDGFSWGPAPGWDGENFNFADLGEIFEDFFGFGRTEKRAGVKRGNDIEIELTMPLEAVLKNQEKTVNVYKHKTCLRCQGAGAEPDTKVKECFSCRGTGEVQQIQKMFFGSFTRLTICPECKGEGRKPEKPCNVCMGDGRTKGNEEIKIYVPAGVDTGQEIKIEGAGDAGKRGGEAGDLYLRVSVKKHPVFKRKGDDLYASISVSFSQAALGDEVEIQTLEGAKLLLRVPEGMESGRVVQISGKGIPHFSGHGRGNVYIEFKIRTPQKLTKKQRELLGSLKKEGV